MVLHVQGSQTSLDGGLRRGLEGFAIALRRVWSLEDGDAAARAVHTEWEHSHRQSTHAGRAS